MLWNPKIFRKNDIRGIYKKDFDLSFVRALARAFVIYSRQKKAVSNNLTLALAHDARLSSPEIADEITKELAFQGVQVFFLGLVPSPLGFFAGHFFSHIQAGIIVTASHNPSEYNGFKFQLYKESLFGKELLKLKDICLQQSQPKIQNKKEVQNKNFQLVKKAGYGFALNPPADTAYVQYMEDQFKIFNKKKNKPLKIAVDCGHGASGPLLKKICSRLNLSVYWLYEKPDGRFPNHHPDPSIEENLKDLKQLVVEKNCDFGAAFDGDGDRLVILNKTGKTLHGDELMALFIADIAGCFKKKADPNTLKASVVADVKCADWFFNFLKKQNIHTILCPSGHSVIRQKTLSAKADFGGELSGHFFFPKDFFSIDDGLYSLLRLIKIIYNNNRPLEELLVKKHSVETNEIRMPIEDKKQAERKLKTLKEYYINKSFVDCQFIDGVRISLKGVSWGLARFSNTQNEITLRFGGKTIKDLEEIQSQFYTLLDIKDS